MSFPRPRDWIAARIPHAGDMCLWDEVLAGDAASIHCRSDRHRRADHPLRRDGRLAAVHLVEYGAQAMAVHGALGAGAAAAPPQAGVLAAVRDFELAVEWLDDLPAPIECQAQRVVANAGGWMYTFTLSCAGRVLARGRASVIHVAA